MPYTCSFCDQPIDGRPCTSEVAVIEGVSYQRRPYDPDYGGPSQTCRDCGTPRGRLHHDGCDMDRCPRCLGQTIACGCHWEGDAPENDEHPDAWKVDMPERTDGPPISAEHAKLLRHANIDWINFETGAPGIDPKRPYGNSYVPGDIHEILTGSRAEHELSDEDEDRYMEIHRGTLGALQAVLDWALGDGDD